MQGILEALLSRAGVEISYITSDPADPLLLHPPQRLHSFYFRRLLPFVIQFLEARALVMTMTDLHRYHIRRSIRSLNHVYLFHALVSTHMIYRGGAFDHYDTILCAGPHHIRELRKAEELYSLKPKRLLEAGYPRLDQLRASHQEYLMQARRTSGKGTVLIAPSWGQANILETCGLALSEEISRAGYRVVVRPHPEFVKRNPEMTGQLSQQIARLPGASMELEYASEKSIHEADVLITDWSGISLEYAFATERPVLFIDVPRKVNNPRYEELGMVPLEVGIREKIGRVLSPGQVSSAPRHIGQMIGQKQQFLEQIARERREHLFHPDRSSEVIAQFLLELTSGL